MICLCQEIIKLKSMRAAIPLQSKHIQRSHNHRCNFPPFHSINIHNHHNCKLACTYQQQAQPAKQQPQNKQASFQKQEEDKLKGGWGRACRIKVKRKERKVDYSQLGLAVMNGTDKCLDSIIAINGSILTPVD